MDLRRVPARDQDVASDPELLASIRDEIRGSGPMTFARFMDLALYDPARGYYRGTAPRPGRAGDFLTAPEAHPLFGRTLARFALAVHAAIGAPSRFDIREHGAGTGALARPLIEALLAADPAPASIRYLVAEVEPTRIAAVREAMADSERVAVEPDDGRPIDGLVLANEVLDALPTHRVVQRRDVLREVFVDLGPDDGLVDREGAPSTPALAARLAAESITLEDGQRAEICLAVDAWIERCRRGPRARRPPPDRLRVPGGGSLRPAPAVRGNAGDVPRPPGRRGSLPRDRPPGPDRPRRSLGRRARGRPGRPDRDRRNDPGRLPEPTRRRRAAGRRADPARRDPPDLPRGSLGPGPDDRPGRDGSVSRPGVRPRPRTRPWACPASRCSQPIRANALLPRHPSEDDAAHVPGDGAHRRGADRELARALGTIRSPTPSSPARRGRSPGQSTGRRAPDPTRITTVRRGMAGPRLTTLARGRRRPRPNGIRC